MRTVLVVTARFDPTADRVVQALYDHGAEVFRIDLAEFPLGLIATAEFLSGRWVGVMATSEREIAIEDIAGIYYRRPGGYTFPAGMSSEEHDWARAEAQAGFGGLLAAIPNWLNRPDRIRAVDEAKPFQLRLAAAAGLWVPRTLVTNDPDAAVRFADSVGAVACKPFLRNRFQDASGARIAYTAKCSADELDDRTIAFTAHQFQEWIDAEFAVRLSVIDDTLVAAAIHAQTDDARIDWRSDYAALSYMRIDVPKDVAYGVRAFMRRLDLRFGTLDFLVTADRRWHFLEIGANAQWAWIEDDAIADSIATAIACSLMRGWRA